MTVGKEESGKEKMPGTKPDEWNVNKGIQNGERESKSPLSKTGSQISIVSKPNCRLSPEGQSVVQEPHQMHLSYSSDSTDFGNPGHSPGSRFPGIEVNPLYDGGRRKSSAARLSKQIAPNNNNDDKSPSINHSRAQSIKNLFPYSSSGIDDADGTFITKSEFLKKWRDQPEMIIEPYNIDTEENVLHFLAREGKLDVLRELCLEQKNSPYIYQALKS